MSDHIPFEIHIEIMKKLPIRPLIQFRSVSKTWKSHIDSSGFVTRYSSQQKHIFVRYRTPDYKSRYVSVADDHTFPLNRVSMTPPSCFLLDQYGYYYIIGCCHGLLCFYTVAEVGGKAGLWNPSIRRAYDVVVPNVADGKVYDTILGFGVCPVTKDPKIVKITFVGRRTKLESIRSIPFQVDVFRLSTGAWRSLNSNLPRKSVYFHNEEHMSYSLTIDGIVHWLATDRMTADGGPCVLIISFDISKEEFGEINLPNGLARSQRFLNLSKQRESLVLIEFAEEPNITVFNLWMMECGLFTQLYTFNVNTEDEAHIMGFRSGRPIIELTEDDRGELVVYEPHSDQRDNLGFDGVSYTWKRYCFMINQILQFLLHEPVLRVQELVDASLFSTLI